MPTTASRSRPDLTDLIQHQHAGPEVAGPCRRRAFGGQGRPRLEAPCLASAIAVHDHQTSGRCDLSRGLRSVPDRYRRDWMS